MSYVDLLPDSDDSPYLTLTDNVVCEIEPIKGSRFIALAFPVGDEAAVADAIAQSKADYPDARHHCWAYRLQEQEKTRFSDDGEPNGSAGKPILAPIVGNELLGVLIVVVRYFGGVKLGVGGLVRAYSQAANAVLEYAKTDKKIITITPKVMLTLQYPYDCTNQVNTALHALDLTTEHSRYDVQVCTDIAVIRKDINAVVQRLADYTAGKIQITANVGKQLYP